MPRGRSRSLQRPVVVSKTKGFECQGRVTDRNMVDARVMVGGQMQSQGFGKGQTQDKTYCYCEGQFQ